MKRIFFLLSLVFFNAQNVYADPAENGPAADSDDSDFALTEAMMLAQTEKDANFQADLLDRLSLLDINDDGFVSDTEIKEMIKGMNTLSNMTETEKKEIAAATEKMFKESDADHDKLLNKTEMETFTKKISVIMIKLEFKKRDINGDGVIDFKDVPPLEESMKKLDEAVKKLDDLSKRMESMSPETMAQNFIKNTGNAIAQEDFYRMDKDRNGCVSANEYVEYELKQQQRTAAENKGEDASFLMTREDLQSLYKMMKKSKPDCITMDEYITQQSSFLDAGLMQTPEQNGESFDLMDKNKDGKLTADEYAAYKMAENAESGLTKEDYIDIFNIASKMEWDISETGQKKTYLEKDAYDRHAEFLDFLISSAPEAKKGKTKEHRNLGFDLMDANKDGKLTAEEFAAYKTGLKANTLKKEDYIEMFTISSEAEKKGYLTKDEFLRKAYLFDLLQSFSSEP